MKKVDEDIVKKINSYGEDASNREIGRQLGISKTTV